MVDTIASANVLYPYGGTQANNLINILRSNDDNDISTLKFSPYMDLHTVKSYLQNNRNNFTVFTLNVQSLNSKFSVIQSLITDLSKDNLLFDAICFQETWLHTNDDVGIFHLPDYNIIHKGKVCCGHGGLVIYLSNQYTHTLRSDLYKDLIIWEGLFIDITGENITNKITLGNIYKPPKNNSNNQNISCFIDEITPSLHTLSKENSYSILAGDFNIDLLKLNDRHLFSTFFDNMCSSGFFPHITVPTRFATNSCSLID